MFFVRKLLFLFIHIFVTHFLKCIQNILKLYLVEYACWFKQLGCFKSFHVPYIPQTPSVYIWSKHESLHPPWVLCALVNFLNRFPNAFLEVKCFKKIGLFNLNYFWTFQIRKRRLGKTILGTEVVKIWINFFHFFKNILLKLFYLIQLEMMFFCQKFLLLVHSYFVKIFLKCILKYIEILFSRYPCLFLTTCVF